MIVFPNIRVERLVVPETGGQACFQTTFKPLCSLCVVAIALNDTLVFLAISIRLLGMIAVEENFGCRMKYLICGRRSFPVLSRTLLNGGQQYYLCVESHLLFFISEL